MQPCEPFTGLASNLNVDLWAGASNSMRTTLTFGGGVSPSPAHPPCPHHATDSFCFQRASPFNYSYIVCSTSCIVHVRPNTPPPRVPHTTQPSSCQRFIHHAWKRFTSMKPMMLYTITHPSQAPAWHLEPETCTVASKVTPTRYVPRATGCSDGWVRRRIRVGKYSVRACMPSRAALSHGVPMRDLPT